jgi:hypothetical protein
MKAMCYMIHKLVLCTIRIFWKIFDFESYKVESSYIRVMVHWERKFQYRLSIPNRILVTLLIKETREEKKTGSKYGRNIRCVCVCVNYIQFPKENCRSRDIWDDTLEILFTVKSSV